MPADVRKNVSEIEMREGIIRVQADGLSRRCFRSVKIPVKPKLNGCVGTVSFGGILLQLKRSRNRSSRFRERVFRSHITVDRQDHEGISQP